MFMAAYAYSQGSFTRGGVCYVKYTFSLLLVWGKEMLY
jgi:hypothetical protein